MKPTLGKPVSVFPTRLEPCSWCGDASRTQRALMRVGDRVWQVPGLRVCSLYTSHGCRAAWLLGQSPDEFRSRSAADLSITIDRT